ncbi:biotin/lipoyl-containing protein [Alicyclobacillus sp. SO9]|uniref:biotin/lipoyl-containing protein n=1 Tax=Alicyclobacillus sp. SO9 TaxID=2665646 RepID=UPI0018E7FFB0|nr:biotin/lipoyl-containing protein [Alicyclobacillus sp. SO9]QQE76944.1 biotin attachment protein [Alicyclobacillus sp. SO9]
MKEFHLPQLGDSVQEGLVTKWLKQPGDKIEKNEPLLEITTDKVSIEVPSDYSGTVATLVVQEGETVAPDAVLCHIDES